jgi:predicted phosphodiesterase
MFNKMLKKLIGLCLVLFTNISLANKVLVLSDIHFTPFAECSRFPLYCNRINSLLDKPITEWSFGIAIPNSYKSETNNYLLTKSLHGLAETLKYESQFDIFITGDMLAHEFQLYYKYYRPLAKHSAVSDFEYKTLSYVLLQIHNAFPKSKIYYVLGNNDTDNGDYNLPSEKWLFKVAGTLSNYVPQTEQAKFTEQFKHGGYYSIVLNDNIQIIGLNTNVFSINANDTIDKNMANQELIWLSAELEGLKKSERKAILLEHIPVGIDAFKTSQGHSGQVSMLLDRKMQSEYINILEKYNNQIASIYAGHLHSEYWQRINEIPVIGTLALNLFFGNNAGVKLIDYNNSDGKINGYTTYTLTFNNNQANWQELYNFPASYNTNKTLTQFIKDFTYNISDLNVVQYRKYYNGGAILFPQPISDNKFWLNYYCYLNYLNENEYNHCLAVYLK